MRTAGRGLRIGILTLALALAAPASGWSHTLTLYGGLFGNKEYIEGWEGIAGALDIGEYVSLLGRMTGVHIIDSDRFREGNSGIGEGGLGFHVAPNTRLSIYGGTYFGDIEDPIVDGDLSTAQMIGDRWIYLSVGGLYGFNSNRWQATGYVSTPITDPAADVVLFAGADAIVYNEGRFRRDGEFVTNPDTEDVKFQLGPDLGVYKRSWNAGLRVGVGGGDYGVYGTMSAFKTFTL